MGVEHLSSASDFAHLDGSLVFPMFVDDYHLLIVEDGSMLLLPEGIQVLSAGRFGIGPEGVPYVDTGVSGEDSLRLSEWGHRLADPEQIARLLTNVERVVAEYPEPEKFVNRIREEI